MGKMEKNKRKQIQTEDLKKSLQDKKNVEQSP